MYKIIVYVWIKDGDVTFEHKTVTIEFEGTSEAAHANAEKMIESLVGQVRQGAVCLMFDGADGWKIIPTHRVSAIDVKVKEFAGGG